MFHFEKLNTNIQNKIRRYTQDLAKLHPDNLKCVALYGDIISSGYHKDIPIKILAVFNTLELKTLKKSRTLVVKGLKHNIIAPLMLTEEHMKSSVDVFPIDFSDLCSRHYILWGHNIFEGIEVDLSLLRLECEQQLKGKLIRLRQSYLEGAKNDTQTRNLMRDSLLSFLPLFEALLHLKANKEVAMLPLGSLNPLDIFAQVETLYDSSCGSFLEIYQNWKDGHKLKNDALESLFANYLDAVGRLAQSVDQVKV